MCSRILWYGKDGKPVIIGRNMDWFEDVGSNFWIMPRGIERDGLTPANPLKWRSKYGSTILTIYDGATADGLNEAGLGGNLLFLVESDYGRRDDAIPGLSIGLWLQFFLDNFATVGEVIDYLEKHPLQVRPLTAGVHEKKLMKAHLSLADRTGDNAIIEFIDGRQVVYHDRKYAVMTNSPPFDQQIAGLKRYKDFGGSEDLPGSTKAADRFVRAAYYLRRLPAPGTGRQAIAGVMSVLRNVSQPFGTAEPDEPNTAPTLWRTVADLDSNRYFYESTTSPYMIWVDLGVIDFSPGSGTRKLSLVDWADLIGDVTSRFERAEPFGFFAPDEEQTPAPVPARA